MSLKEPIPLLRLFGQCKPTGYLSELAENCIVHDACLCQKERTADLLVAFGDRPPNPASRRALETVLAGCYGMSRVTLRPMEPAEQLTEAREVASVPTTEDERPPIPEEEPPEPEAPPTEEEDVFSQTAALREAAMKEAVRNVSSQPRKQRPDRAEPVASVRSSP